MSHVNLFDVLRARALSQPDHDAFRDARTGLRCTYGELIQRIECASRQLANAGVCPGQCVGLHSPNGLAYIVWAYAVWHRGATVVPVPPELPVVDKQSICASIGISAVISVENTNSPGRSHVDLPALPSPVLLDAGAVLFFLPQPPVHPPAFTSVNAAFVRFTSGTTSTRKGVVLSHETVLDRIDAANDALRIGPDDTIIWMLSMSYHFTVSIVGYLTFGACVVQCEDFLGRTIVNTAATNQATVIYASPAHYAFMNRDRSGTRLPTLRLAISTTSPLKLDTAETFRARFGVAISQAYGIIEVGLPCINLAAPDSKPTSVGPPLPAYELRLRDIGLGATLHAIDVRGKGIVDAYYEPWQPRDSLLRDGWFVTGDLGYLDNDGCLFVVDRSNAMINVAGMKTFPQEIEAVLEQHPGVAEAFVYGVPNAALDEVPVADIVINPTVPERPTAEALQAHCKDRLARYKIPVSYRFVQELPRTATGKLIRRTPSAGAGKLM